MKNTKINTEVPIELKKQIKIYCANNNISIKDFIIKILQEFFNGSTK